MNSLGAADNGKCGQRDYTWLTPIGGECFSLTDNQIDGRFLKIGRIPIPCEHLSNLDPHLCADALFLGPVDPG